MSRLLFDISSSERFAAYRARGLSAEHDIDLMLRYFLEHRARHDILAYCLQHAECIDIVSLLPDLFYGGALISITDYFFTDDAAPYYAFVRFVISHVTATPALLGAIHPPLLYFLDSLMTESKRFISRRNFSAAYMYISCVFSLCAGNRGLMDAFLARDGYYVLSSLYILEIDLPDEHTLPSVVPSRTTQARDDSSLHFPDRSDPSSDRGSTCHNSLEADIVLFYSSRDKAFFRMLFSLFISPLAVAQRLYDAGFVTALERTKDAFSRGQTEFDVLPALQRRILSAISLLLLHDSEAAIFLVFECRLLDFFVRDFVTLGGDEDKLFLGLLHRVLAILVRGRRGELSDSSLTSVIQNCQRYPTLFPFVHFLVRSAKTFTSELVYQMLSTVYAVYIAPADNVFEDILHYLEEHEYRTVVGTALGHNPSLLRDPVFVPILLIHAAAEINPKDTYNNLVKFVVTQNLSIQMAVLKGISVSFTSRYEHASKLILSCLINIDSCLHDASLALEAEEPNADAYRRIYHYIDTYIRILRVYVTANVLQTSPSVFQFEGELVANIIQILSRVISFLRTYCFPFSCALQLSWRVTDALSCLRRMTHQECLLRVVEQSNLYEGLVYALHTTSLGLGAIVTDFLLRLFCSYAPTLKCSVCIQNTSSGLAVQQVLQHFLAQIRNSSDCGIIRSIRPLLVLGRYVLDLGDRGLLFSFISLIVALTDPFILNEALLSVDCVKNRNALAGDTDFITLLHDMRDFLSIRPSPRAEDVYSATHCVFMRHQMRFFELTHSLDETLAMFATLSQRIFRQVFPRQSLQHYLVEYRLSHILSPASYVFLDDDYCCAESGSGSFSSGGKLPWLGKLPLALPSSFSLLLWVRPSSAIEPAPLLTVASLEDDSRFMSLSTAGTKQGATSSYLFTLGNIWLEFAAPEPEVDTATDGQHCPAWKCLVVTSSDCLPSKSVIAPHSTKLVCDFTGENFSKRIFAPEKISLGHEAASAETSLSSFFATLCQVSSYEEFASFRAKNAIVINNLYYTLGAGAATSQMPQPAFHYITLYSDGEIICSFVCMVPSTVSFLVPDFYVAMHKGISYGTVGLLPYDIISTAVSVLGVESRDSTMLLQSIGPVIYFDPARGSFLHHNIICTTKANELASHALSCVFYDVASMSFVVVQCIDGSDNPAGASTDEPCCDRVRSMFNRTDYSLEGATMMRPIRCINGTYESVTAESDPSKLLMRQSSPPLIFNQDMLRQFILNYLVQDSRERDIVVPFLERALMQKRFTSCLIRRTLLSSAAFKGNDNNSDLCGRKLCAVLALRPNQTLETTLLVSYNLLRTRNTNRSPCLLLNDVIADLYSLYSSIQGCICISKLQETSPPAAQLAYHISTWVTALIHYAAIDSFRYCRQLIDILLDYRVFDMLDVLLCSNFKSLITFLLDSYTVDTMILLFKTLIGGDARRYDETLPKKLESSAYAQLYSRRFSIFVTMFVTPSFWQFASEDVQTKLVHFLTTTISGIVFTILPSLKRRDSPDVAICSDWSETASFMVFDALVWTREFPWLLRGLTLLTFAILQRSSKAQTAPSGSLAPAALDLLSLILEQFGTASLSVFRDFVLNAEKSKGVFEKPSKAITQFLRVLHVSLMEMLVAFALETQRLLAVQTFLTVLQILKVAVPLVSNLYTLIDEAVRFSMKDVVIGQPVRDMRLLPRLGCMLSMDPLNAVMLLLTNGFNEFLKQTVQSIANGVDASSMGASLEELQSAQQLYQETIRALTGVVHVDASLKKLFKAIYCANWDKLIAKVPSHSAPWKDLLDLGHVLMSNGTIVPHTKCRTEEDDASNALFMFLFAPRPKASILQALAADVPTSIRQAFSGIVDSANAFSAIELFKLCASVYEVVVAHNVVAPSLVLSSYIERNPLDLDDEIGVPEHSTSTDNFSPRGPDLVASTSDFMPQDKQSHNDSVCLPEPVAPDTIHRRTLDKFIRHNKLVQHGPTKPNAPGSKATPTSAIDSATAACRSATEDSAEPSHYSASRPHYAEASVCAEHLRLFTEFSITFDYILQSMSTMLNVANLEAFYVYFDAFVTLLSNFRIENLHTLSAEASLSLVTMVVQGIDRLLRETSKWDSTEPAVFSSQSLAKSIRLTNLGSAYSYIQKVVNDAQGGPSGSSSAPSTMKSVVAIPRSLSNITTQGKRPRLQQYVFTIVRAIVLLASKLHVTLNSSLTQTMLNNDTFLFYFLVTFSLHIYPFVSKLLNTPIGPRTGVQLDGCQAQTSVLVEDVSSHSEDSCSLPDSDPSAHMPDTVFASTIAEPVEILLEREKNTVLKKLPYFILTGQRALREGKTFGCEVLFRVILDTLLTVSLLSNFEATRCIVDLVAGTETQMFSDILRMALRRHTTSMAALGACVSIESRSASSSQKRHSKRRQNRLDTLRVGEYVHYISDLSNYNEHSLSESRDQRPEPEDTAPLNLATSQLFSLLHVLLQFYCKTSLDSLDDKGGKDDTCDAGQSIASSVIATLSYASKAFELIVVNPFIYNAFGAYAFIDAGLALIIQDLKTMTSVSLRKLDEERSSNLCSVKNSILHGFKLFLDRSIRLFFVNFCTHEECNLSDQDAERGQDQTGVGTTPLSVSASMSVSVSVSASFLQEPLDFRNLEPARGSLLYILIFEERQVRLILTSEYTHNMGADKCNSTRTSPAVRSVAASYQYVGTPMLHASDLFTGICYDNTNNDIANLVLVFVTEASVFIDLAAKASLDYATKEGDEQCTRSFLLEDAAADGLDSQRPGVVFSVLSGLLCSDKQKPTAAQGSLARLVRDTMLTLSDVLKACLPHSVSFSAIKAHIALSALLNQQEYAPMHIPTITLLPANNVSRPSQYTSPYRRDDNYLLTLSDVFANSSGTRLPNYYTKIRRILPFELLTDIDMAGFLDENHSVGDSLSCGIMLMPGSNRPFKMLFSNVDRCLYILMDPPTGGAVYRRIMQQYAETAFRFVLSSHVNEASVALQKSTQEHTLLHSDKYTRPLITRLAIDGITCVVPRNYAGLPSCVDVSTMSGCICTFVFVTPEMSQAFVAALSNAKLLHYLPPISIQRYVNNILRNAWAEDRLSNFKYLLELNVLAGRSFNDVSQYPVMPSLVNWDALDAEALNGGLDGSAESEDSEVTSPMQFSSVTFERRILRDMSKPVICLDRDRLVALLSKRDMALSFNLDGDCLSNIHYMHSATPAWFGVRCEPFTTCIQLLQSGRFDAPDRVFFSVNSQWANSSRLSSQNCEELTPDVYMSNILLYNVNGQCFGQRSDGTVVDNVLLPVPIVKLSRNCAEFISSLLETSHVTAALTQWVSIIFGKSGGYVVESDIHEHTGLPLLEGVDATKFLSIYAPPTYIQELTLEQLSDLKACEGMMHQLMYFGRMPTPIVGYSDPIRLARGGSTVLSALMDHVEIVNDGGLTGISVGTRVGMVQSTSVSAVAHVSPAASRLSNEVEDFDQHLENPQVSSLNDINFTLISKLVNLKVNHGEQHLSFSTVPFVVGSIVRSYKSRTLLSEYGTLTKVTERGYVAAGQFIHGRTLPKAHVLHEAQASTRLDTLNNPYLHAAQSNIPRFNELKDRLSELVYSFRDVEANVLTRSYAAELEQHAAEHNIVLGADDEYLCLPIGCVYIDSLHRYVAHIDTSAGRVVLSSVFTLQEVCSFAMSSTPSGRDVKALGVLLHPAQSSSDAFWFLILRVSGTIDTYALSNNELVFPILSYLFTLPSSRSFSRIFVSQEFAVLVGVDIAEPVLVLFDLAHMQRLCEIDMRKFLNETNGPKVTHVSFSTVTPEMLVCTTAGTLLIHLLDLSPCVINTLPFSYGVFGSACAMMSTNKYILGACGPKIVCCFGSGYANTTEFNLLKVAQSRLKDVKVSTVRVTTIYVAPDDDSAVVACTCEIGDRRILNIAFDLK